MFDNIKWVEGDTVNGVDLRVSDDVPSDKYIRIKKFNRSENQSRFDMPPLSWASAKKEDGSTSIFIRCPEGHIAYLDHEINDAGKVHPSVVCPEPPNEHWHVWAILEDWGK